MCCPLSPQSPSTFFFICSIITPRALFGSVLCLPWRAAHAGNSLGVRGLLLWGSLQRFGALCNGNLEWGQRREVRPGNERGQNSIAVVDGSVTTILQNVCRLWGQERGKADRDIPLTMDLVPRKGTSRFSRGRVTR